MRRHSCAAPSAVTVSIPSNRPIPWSSWTTRSSFERLEASVRKLSPRRRRLVGRVNLSPRISCSLNTKASPTVNPCSISIIAKELEPIFCVVNSGQDARSRTSFKPCSDSKVASRSLAPWLLAVINTRRFFSPAKRSLTSSKRFFSARARTAAKSMETRPPQST